MKTSEYTEQVRDILTRLPHDQIDKAIEVLMTARAHDRRIFIMGNGGSGSTASHIAGDLMKGCHGWGESLVMCLNDNMATFSAWANDAGYEKAFSWQIMNLLGIGDVVIAISASGDSINVLRGLAAAHDKATTIVLTGYAGGAAKDIADISIIVPSDNMQQIEDVHLMIGHMIALAMNQTVSTSHKPPKGEPKHGIRGL